MYNEILGKSWGIIQEWAGKGISPSLPLPSELKCLPLLKHLGFIETLLNPSPLPLTFFDMIYLYPHLKKFYVKPLLYSIFVYMFFLTWKAYNLKLKWPISKLKHAFSSYLQGLLNYVLKFGIFVRSKTTDFWEKTMDHKTI